MYVYKGNIFYFPQIIENLKQTPTNVLQYHTFACEKHFFVYEKIETNILGV